MVLAATPRTTVFVDQEFFVSAHPETVSPVALSTANAAKYVGVSAGHLRTLRSRGIGPAYVRLTDSPVGNVTYLVRDLDDWLASRPRVEGGQ